VVGLGVGGGYYNVGLGRRGCHPYLGFMHRFQLHSHSCHILKGYPLESPTATTNLNIKQIKGLHDKWKQISRRLCGCCPSSLNGQGRDSCPYSWLLVCQEKSHSLSCFSALQTQILPSYRSQDRSVSLLQANQRPTYAVGS